MPARPLILISNDDGISAPGILALAEAIAPLGEIVVVAPATEQSAVGHAITVRRPIRAHEYAFQLADGSQPTAFAVDGTPADCVKLAIDQLLPRRPDLVVSGINQGPNAAVNVIYSGTVSAATEGSILGIDAIAFSLDAWTGGDFAVAGHFAEQIAGETLRRGLPPGLLLNVNIPDLPLGEITGIDVTRQARARWEETFTARADPFDRPYYWMAGRFVNLDKDGETDLDALASGAVTVTPIHHDLTAHAFRAELDTWEF